jgi:Sortase and related acyltransferases
MNLNIRKFNPATDYPGRVEVAEAYNRMAVTEAGLRDDDARLDERYQIHRIVAEVDGVIAGVGSASHPPYELAGGYRARVIVRPEHRNRTIGSAMYTQIEEYVRQCGGAAIYTAVRDDEPESRQFAENREFRVKRHDFESVLLLEVFDPTPFAGLINGLQAEGFRFFSLADLGNGEEVKRQLDDLNTETGLDIPGMVPETTRAYEDFSKDVFESSWYRAEGQIVAALGDRWAGMAAVGATDPDGMYNMHTGVRREFRGRKLATALKLLAIDFARRSGARTLRTNNDSENAPMIRINRKLGYIPQPGWLKMEKKLL